MHYAITDAAGVLIIQGYSSEAITPPLDAGQTVHWSSEPFPIASIKDPAPEELLVIEKSQADLRVREQAEVRRRMFITPGAGKAMAYQQKAAEADGFLADESPTAERYPHIYGEAEAIGITPTDMAHLIVGLRDQWQRASAAIERIERGAILAVQDATTLDAVQAAVAIDWGPVEAIAQSETSA